MKKLWKPLALVLALVVAFGGGLYFARRGGGTTAVSADLTSQRLEAMAELATVEYHYTNMARFENSLALYGWTVPLTEKSFILSYDGKIKAGIDMAGATVEMKDKAITVTLPGPKVLSHEIDEDSITVFDEKNNIFNPISVSDYTVFSAQQKKTVEENAVGKGLLTAARQNAEERLTALLLALDGAYGEYTIQYIWK